jgi:hypothetical protein
MVITIVFFNEPKDHYEQVNGLFAFKKIITHIYKVTAWFDEYEDDSNVYENYYIERVKFIKNMLFDLYSDLDQVCYLFNII